MGETAQLVPDVPTDLVFLGDLNLLATTAEKVKPSGFLLLHSPAEAMNAQGTGDLQIQNFVLVAKKTSAAMAMALYRKVEQATPTVFHAPLIEDEEFEWVTALQGLLQTANVDDASRIYITSQSPSSGILGLFKCLLREQLEGKERRLRCIFDPENTLSISLNPSRYYSG